MSDATPNAPRITVALASHGESLGGGAELSLFELAVALERDGRVEPVVTVPRDGPLAAALRAASIRTVVLPTPLWTPFDPRTFRGAFKGLAARGRLALQIARSVRPWVRWLRAERPDIVLTNTATIPTPALASAAVRIPHVWWLHELVTKDFGLRYLLGEPLSQRVIGWLSRVVVASSQAVRDHFSPPIRDQKMQLIWIGIDGVEATPNRIEPGTLRAVLLGRQIPTKGQRVAFEAVSILERDGIRVDLRLVGPIRLAYRMQLRQLAADLGIADRVEIVGAVPTAQDELAHADVVLMCSEHEAYGRVTVEALKSGRPVVGTGRGGTAELITDGVDGFLFEPGDAQALADALRRLSGDPGLLARMSEHASASTRDRYTIDAEVEAFVTMLSDVASARPR